MGRSARRILVAVCALLAIGACKRSGSKVVLTEWAGQPLLLVNGEPFSIRGVTFGVSGGRRNELRTAFEELKAMNVNAIRLWNVDDDTSAILDMAARYDIRVMVGFWLRHGQPSHQGNDRFDWIGDTAGRRAQWDAVLDGVRRFRHHQAVLMWALGNEVIVNIASEEARIAHAKFLGRLASEVKKLDAKHPVTSAGATSVPWPYWREHCEDLDLYGVNVYGPVITELTQQRRDLGIHKPLVVTEFGVTGIWDVAPNSDGAQLEPTDAERHRAIASGWTDRVLPATEHLGGFVFHYADTTVSDRNWWSTRVDGRTRPTYWAIREAFTGQAPENRIPMVRQFATRRPVVGVDTWIPLDIDITDPEGEPVELEFFAEAERDGARVAQPLVHRGGLDVGVKVKGPPTNGVWILSLLGTDRHRNLALAQTSVIVDESYQPTPSNSQSFPFFVYRDADSADNHYAPTGQMGDRPATVDFGWQTDAQQGTSVRVQTSHGDGWYGLAWLDPPNDWGGRAGGYDLTGATTLSFLARGQDGGETVTFAFGILEKDKEWFDTGGAQLTEVRLTHEWRRYSIPLEGRDLSRIKTGFAFFVRNRERGLTFFVDDIKYR